MDITTYIQEIVDHFGFGRYNIANIPQRVAVDRTEHPFINQLMLDNGIKLEKKEDFRISALRLVKQVCRGNVPFRYVIELNEILDDPYHILGVAVNNGADIKSIYVNEMGYNTPSTLLHEIGHILINPPTDFDAKLIPIRETEANLFALRQMMKHNLCPLQAGHLMSNLLVDSHFFELLDYVPQDSLDRLAEYA